jgi:hypothetical protein
MGDTELDQQIKNAGKNVSNTVIDNRNYQTIAKCRKLTCLRFGIQK